MTVHLNFVESSWKDFERRCLLPGDPNEHRIAAMHAAFQAGAVAVFYFMTDQLGSLPESEAFAQMNALHSEFKAMCEEYVLKTNTKAS